MVSVLDSGTSCAPGSSPEWPGTLCCQYSWAGHLRGKKLNYKSVAKEISKPLFLAPEVQWALKVYRVCSIHVFVKCFEPHPYLVCHVTTIENV